MKTKLEMAHEWMMKHDDGSMSVEVVVFKAWQYADAMQAEADKRENKTRPEVLMVVQQTFINGIEQPRYATSMGDQKRTPKVSRFERSDAVKEVLSRAENMGLIKPKADKEWQPDWSQAPDGYNWFVVGGRSGKGFFCLVEPSIVKDHYWFVGEDCLSVDKHNYQGDWRNSLRKRPQ